ncbi:hypothetical protein M408DRAFT_29522 [Serendipita vermifera MAFF 305830]|uniref:Small ribosomal subunit protein mS41 n=1 Tax=Serendipita vermifera MAFF 305830 TaxID=933852 RepID=A0A0C3AA32_SERVB|nr:hypothetical protein M408DRAFT_29522 [Serendipita vermifera MAFF 305830]
MTSLIRIASRTASTTRRTLLSSHITTYRRLFADGSDNKPSASRGEPAAAVPNTPSPFQLTPESLKQQKEVEAAARVPSNNRGYTTKTLLTEFGRGCDTKLPDVENMSWEELFRMNNQKLQKVGMEPTERRYLLWCLEKFRQGEDPKVYAREPPPKKKHRGWGPPAPKKKPDQAAKGV